MIFDLKKNAILKNYKIDKFENKNIKYSFNNIEQDENSSHLRNIYLLSSGSKFSKMKLIANLKRKIFSAFVKWYFFK